MRNANPGNELRQMEGPDYPADMRNCTEDNDLRHKRNLS